VGCGTILPSNLFPTFQANTLPSSARV